MDSTSLVHPARTILVDERLCEEIAELTRIEYRVLRSAFIGEEKNLALEVVKTLVAENLQGAPEEWQHRVLVWAKENGSGGIPARLLRRLRAYLRVQRLPQEHRVILMAPFAP